MKAIVIGIIPQEKIRERAFFTARGNCKPKPSEPKIWFTSMRSLAGVLSDEILSDENSGLLRAIQECESPEHHDP